MKQLSIKISILIFFAMSVIGLACDQAMEVVAMRSLLGGAVGFTASYFALKLAVIVMQQAVVENPAKVTVTDMNENSKISAGNSSQNADGKSITTEDVKSGNSNESNE